MGKIYSAFSPHFPLLFEEISLNCRIPEPPGSAVGREASLGRPCQLLSVMVAA